MTVDHNSIGGLRVLIVVIKKSQEHIDIDAYTHARMHARTHTQFQSIIYVQHYG